MKKILSISLFILAILLVAKVIPFSSIAEAEGFTPVTVLGGTKLPFSLVDGVKVFKLEATTVITMFHDPTQPGNKKKEILTYGYNGSMPGPLIEVVNGDRVRIEFTNSWPEATTVHWHGIELPNNMDGGSSVTQKLVEPGGSYTYEYTINQTPGTYMYHSGHMQALQVGMGSSGFFIIHPKNAKNYKVDHDYAFMLQTWAIPAHKTVPDTASMNFNYFTMNGKPGPDIPHMEVQKGKKIRIRLANLSMMSHPIHIHGYNFMVTDMGGGMIPESARWPANTMSINAGETRAFEIDNLHTVGKWMFHCHFLHHIMNDMEFIPIPGQPHMMMHAQGMFTMLDVIEN